MKVIDPLTNPTAYGGKPEDAFDVVIPSLPGYGLSLIHIYGGFAHDDTNVILLVANPSFTARTVSTPTATTQVAPTIIKALGLEPKALDAVRAEGTAVLPEVEAQLAK